MTVHSPPFRTDAELNEKMSPGDPARQVQEILDRYPRITWEGHGLSNLNRYTPQERTAETARQHGQLSEPDTVAGIASAADWAGAHWNKIKTVNQRHSSYGLKHVYEFADGGCYITNGEFIVALLLAGFTAPMNDGLNPCFAISERSLTPHWRRR